MRMVRNVSLFVGAAVLAGCVGVNVEQLNDTDIPGDSFTQNLAREYRDLANFEAFEMQDWADAEYFAQKGLQSSAGGVVEPAVLAEWDLPSGALGDLTDGRARLVAALNASGRDNFSMEAAIAQSRFDCWVEQQEENHQPDHIAACRDEFFAALAILEGVAPADESFLVFFDFDRSNIRPDAQEILNGVVTMVMDMPSAPAISVVGHADRSGSAAYNIGLSQRRAAAVEGALVAGGVAADMITTSGLGESQPLVPTPDGVREPSNRRAEIQIGQ